MIKNPNFRPSGVSLPPLTHQRVQELKQTPKGQRIMQEAFNAFPELVKSLTNALQEKLNSFTKTRLAQNSQQEGLTLNDLVEEYQFLEFVQFIMFVKWKEEKNKQTSRYLPGNLQANWTPQVGNPLVHIEQIGVYCWASSAWPAVAKKFKHKKATAGRLSCISPKYSYLALIGGIPP